MKRVTELAHEAVRAVVRSGETVVDATMGNGHDTLFLARCVGRGGRVYGFDVQKEACAATLERVHQAAEQDGWLHEVFFHPLHAGHEEMAKLVQGPVAAVMFNLGYQPGGDHAITTMERSTLEALQQAWELLRLGGVISVVCYRGHPGGAEEAEAVLDWAGRLEGCSVSVAERDGREDGPFLVIVGRDAGESMPVL